MEQFQLEGKQLTLLEERAIFLPEEKTLLLADLHLGKVNHFRRSGISVPQKANEKNLERLIKLIQAQHPERVIFLGDLFHSNYNSEWEVFGQMIKSFAHLKFELVVGNHDILSKHQYEKLAIEMHEETLALGPFTLSHEPLETPFEGYNLAGHIHPAVRLRGSARQSLRLSCFYFGKNQGILPAFGEFTGAYTITPKKGDAVFVIAEGNVVPVG